MAGDLVDAYLTGAAAAFFDGHPSDPAARRRAVERARRPLAPAVADVLDAQNARLAPSPARLAHLAALRRGAAAVVTGQQVGLFLGPLYTIHKAASAIQVARALAAETGAPVVPVFWLQTEDHDLPEIASCAVPGRHGGAVEVSVPSSAADRVSIGERALPPEVSGCLAELRAELGAYVHGEEHLARLARHYRPGAGWGAAFAGVLSELFAAEGLVIVDPRDRALAASAWPVHERALREAGAIAAGLLARTAALEGAGYPAQIHVRRGAPLSFFHPQGPSGPRYRLEPAGDDTFVEVGGDGRHRLGELLAADPAQLSTSALLRPVLEDSLLPTAAYVGGPGELAYFAQLQPLYEHFGVSMPLFVLRARFRVVEDRTRRLLNRLGLESADAGRSEDELLARGRRPGSAAPAVSAAQLTAAFDASLAQVAPGLTAVVPRLERDIAKARAAVARAVNRLVTRAERAVRAADLELVDSVRRLQDLLHPSGVPQERYHGLPYFAARHGDRAFVELVLAAVEPFHPVVKDLEP